MTTLVSQLPDFIYRQAQSFAQQEQISMDQLISLALSSQLSIWSSTQYLEIRSQRADWSKFRDTMARVPSAEPEDDDRFEPVTGN